MTYKSNQNKPAPSNSRLSDHLRDTSTQKALKVSWDRMTLIGNLKDEQVKKFRDFCATNPLVTIVKSATDLVVARMYDEAFYVEYDRLKGQSYGRRNMRVEFNPNKCTEKERVFLQEHVLSCMSDLGFSRLDLAIDVDFNLSEFTFITKNPVKETVVYGKDGSVETSYLGSRESEKYIRVYNKQRELEDKGFQHDGVIWRLEFELKRAAVDQWMNVFDDLTVKKPAWKSLKDPREKAMVHMLIDHKDEWGFLNRKTRAKYRKLFKEIEGEDATGFLQNVLKQNKIQLKESLEKWMGKFIEEAF